MYIFGPKINKFGAKSQKISKNSFPVVRLGNLFLMAADERYDVPDHFAYSQMQNKYVAYINEFFEKRTFWDPKSTNLAQNLKNLKKFVFLSTTCKLVINGRKRTLRCF